MTKSKKTFTKTTSKGKKPLKSAKLIDPLKLEQALYKAEFDFEKALCKFFVVGNSLKTMKENLVIGGNKVELAVYERRLTKEVRSWFNEWGWKIGKNKMTIEYKGIPIEVKLIKEVVAPYLHPDVMFYKSMAQYEIPNPWRSA